MRRRDTSDGWLVGSYRRDTLAARASAFPLAVASSRLWNVRMVVPSFKPQTPQVVPLAFSNTEKSSIWRVT